MDMLIVTCDSVSKSTGIGSGCKLNIAYNKQLPICTSATARSIRNGKAVCRPPDGLCEADPDFTFNLQDSPDNKDFVSVPIADVFPSPDGSSPAQYLLVQDTTYDPPLPVPIKLGDLNQDGFPDILAIVASGSGSRADRTPRLAYSVPCAKGVAGCGSDGSGYRGWLALTKGGEVLQGIKDARNTAFLDVDEDVWFPLRLSARRRY